MSSFAKKLIAQGVISLSASLGAWAHLPAAQGQETPATKDAAVKDMGADILSEEERQKYRSLLTELDSSQFQRREDATTELGQLDERFLPLLQDSLDNHKSPDAKARLQGIVARKVEARRQRMTREFLRSPSIPETHEFQGWLSFSEASGFRDRKTKGLFLRLLESYPWLVYEKISTPDEAYEKALRVASTISPRLDIAGEVTEEDGIAMAYTAALCGEKLDKGLEVTAHRVFSRHPFSTKLVAVNRNANANSSNAILAFYTRFADHAKNKFQLLVSCLNAQIPVASKVAHGLLDTTDAAKDPETFELAMMCLARFGSAEDIPVVDKWLTDGTVIREAQRIGYPESGSNSLVTIEIQARDLALATTILLHKESPHLIFPQFRTHAMRGFVSESIGLPADEPVTTRDEMLRQWRERSNNTPDTLPTSQ